MSVSCSPYQLEWKHKPGSFRRGALLRFSFADGATGFADCFTWPEFGDDPLEVQLHMLAKGDLTPLTVRAQCFARLDADARKQKVNLFAETQLPFSHALIPSITVDDELPDASHYKVKLGDHLAQEIPELKRVMREHPTAKFRLDFNGQINQLVFEDFLQKTASFHHQIDFIEDPFPYDESAWRGVQKAYGVPLAIDRGASRALGKKDVAEVVVLKPAKHDEKMVFGTDQRIVLTSYLDHPIGQLSSAYFAAKMGAKEPGGFLSHTAYVSNPFSERLGIAGQRLIPPLQGTGFGFDDLLKKLEWHPL